MEFKKHTATTVLHKNYGFFKKVSRDSRKIPKLRNEWTLQLWNIILILHIFKPFHVISNYVGQSRHDRRKNDVILKNIFCHLQIKLPFVSKPSPSKRPHQYHSKCRGNEHVENLNYHTSNLSQESPTFHPLIPPQAEDVLYELNTDHKFNL